MKDFSDMLPRFELISERHNTSLFDCRYTWMNDFLRLKALEETRRDASRTFVLIDASDTPAAPVLGYFTLRADSFYDNVGMYGSVIVPVVEIVFLARHIGLRGQGVGDFLLIQALTHVVEVSKWIGVTGVHLAFTQEGKPLYDRFGFGEHPYGVHNLFLSLGDIRTAIGIVE